LAGLSLRQGRSYRSVFTICVGSLHDNLIGSGEDRGWDRQAKHLGRPEIDHDRRHTPRITVDDDPGLHFYTRFGVNLIGATHRHTMRLDRMAMMLAVDRPQDWGETLYRHFLFGHIHHESAKEVGGVRSGPTCRGLKAGQLEFVDGGWHPGSCERWVEVRDDLSLSLLQASLIELNRPIRVVVEGG
jgi:hypothetical protein